jgi:hypothetical protein
MSYLSDLNEKDHTITRTDAATLYTALDTVKESMLATGYQNNDTVVLHETFNVAAIRALMDQTDCHGLRVRLGMDGSNKMRVILCAIAEDGTDVVERYISSPADPMENVPTLIDEAGQRWP